MADRRADRRRAWQEKQRQIHIPRELAALVDHHAQAVDLSRRAMILRTLHDYTASAAKDVAVEQETRGRQARERLEGGEG